MSDKYNRGQIVVVHHSAIGIILNCSSHSGKPIYRVLVSPEYLMSHSIRDFYLPLEDQLKELLKYDSVSTLKVSTNELTPFKGELNLSDIELQNS